MTVAAERPVTADRPMAGCPRRRERTSVDGAAPPQIAEGVQLLGEYAGSGYEQPQYLARRPGGQLVQLSRLLHLVADACDGSSSYEEIAQRVSETFGKTVSADNVRTLVQGKLRPLGVLAAADGTSPPVQESDPLLGLKLRTQLLRPRAVQRLAAISGPMFWPPVVVAVVAGLAAVDMWLFFVHGVGGGLRESVQQPVVFLLVAAVVAVSAALHELGHAAACAYGGAKPGGMGAGIYVVWPAFYTDVTDAHRLGKKGRLRTDLGGVYVNAAIVVVTAAVYAITRFEPLVLLCLLLQIQVLQQLLPFLRLDGYYVVSDLVGVPDLFRRIGPVLRSAIPFRKAEPEVSELKPWARRVVAGWVFVLVPVLAVNLGYFVLSAPRIAATSWDSAARFVGTMTSAGGTQAAFAAVQLLLLVLPTLGITYTVVRVARRVAAGAWRWSHGSWLRRGSVLAAAAVLVAVLTLAWYPDGRLTPYREGERGTVQQHVQELSAFRSGTPLLRSPQEAQEPLSPVPDGGSVVLDDGTAGSTSAGQPQGMPTSGVPPTPTSATPSEERTSEPTSEPTSSRESTPSRTSSAEPTSASTRSSEPSSSATSQPSPSGSATATPTD